MDPFSLDKLLALLAHPVSLSVFCLVIAAAVAGAVGAQLRAIGLDRRPPTDGRLAWSTALAAGAFWGTLIAGLSLVARVAGATHLADLLGRAFLGLLGLAPSGLILAGASHFRAIYLRDAADRSGVDERAAKRHADMGTLAAGVLAAISAAGQSVLPTMLVVGAALGLYWVSRDPANRVQLSAWWEDLQAGGGLRQRGLLPGATLEARGRTLRLLGVVGPVSTRLHEGDEEVVLRNSELLEMVIEGRLLEAR